MLNEIEYAYQTKLGKAFIGDSLLLIDELEEQSINLVFTSPPFALLRKKDYGNKEQDEYVEWLAEFARKIMPKLKDDGSLVIDLGGAYQKGFPIRSLYNYKVLIHFCEILGYNLAEEFFWNNPAKLPSPIEWVNKRKIRVKDSVNTVWWFSKSKFPKSDTTAVLNPYSDRMKKLIKDPDAFYKPAVRPSGHDIGKSFGVDNGGAIPSNLLSYSNSESNSRYMKHCKDLGMKTHPARFPKKLPEFFVKFLTNEGDIVLDIFGGSNTTGEVCEELNRKWLSFEISPEYVATSAFRFINDERDAKVVYETILSGNFVDFNSVVEENYR